MKKMLAMAAAALAVMMLAGCTAPARQEEPAQTSAQTQPAPVEEPAQTAASESVRPGSSEGTSAEEPGKLILISVEENVAEGQSSVYSLANSDAQQEISYTYSDSGPINEGNDDVHVSYFEWDQNAWDRAMQAIEDCKVLQWKDAYGDVDGEQADNWRVELTYDDNGEITTVVKQGAGGQPAEWMDLQQDLKGAYRRLAEVE